MRHEFTWRRAGHVGIALVALAGCGGGSGAGNPAEEKAFEYEAGWTDRGIPAAYAVDRALRVFEGGLSAEVGYSAQTALLDGASSLLGSDSVSDTGWAPGPACADLSAGCSSVTADEVRFTGCSSDTVVLFASTDGRSGSARLTTVLDGSVWRSGDTVGWRYTVKTRTSAGEDGTYTDSGTLTLRGGTLAGHQDLEWWSPAPAPGLGAARMAQAVDLDVTWDRSCAAPCTIDGQDASCPSPVVAGSLEAKRVWVQKATGTASPLADRAARITWSGCNQGTIQRSTGWPGLGARDLSAPSTSTRSP